MLIKLVAVFTLISLNVQFTCWYIYLVKPGATVIVLYKYSIFELQENF